MLRVPLVALLLGIPAALALMALPTWFFWSGIPAPDQTVIPQLAPLVGYGVAFGFGWLVHRSRDALASIARHWLPNLLAGTLAAAWMLASLRALPPMAPAGFPANPFDLADGAILTKAGFAVMSSLTAWGLALGITGAALRFLTGYSPLRRYLADASYWVYLAHLPLVAALQVWVGHWALPWGIKYPFVLAASLAVLFASYHWLVRPTVVGQLLNGRRHPPRRPATGSQESPLPAPSPREDDGSPVAELRGISKTFGKVAALDRVDLQVRRGELLAVLGPNGAGKSTAISLWLGLAEADSGEVGLLGGDPREPARRQRPGRDDAGRGDAQGTERTRTGTAGLQLLHRSAATGRSAGSRGRRRLRRPALRQALGRAEAPGPVRGGHLRSATRPVPRRTHGRPRRPGAPGAVGQHPRPARGRMLHRAHHALPEEAEALADRVAVIAGGRVIATGSVDDMRALVARRRISCESRLSAAEVGGWPGVLDARLERDRLHLTASDAETVVRRLLSEDPTLARLEVR